MRTLLITGTLSVLLFAGCSYHDHDDYYGRYKRGAPYCDDVGYARYEYRDHGHYRHHDRHHDGHRRHHDRYGHH